MLPNRAPRRGGPAVSALSVQRLPNSTPYMQRAGFLGVGNGGSRGGAPLLDGKVTEMTRRAESFNFP